MLVKAEDGNYLKYHPTKEEVIKMFKEWKNTSVIKPHELPEILKENLTKWNMFDLYFEIREELKK
jgi:L-asparaginase/Glu-tRNA(Gln) amidotransferase subunit D